MQKVTINRVTGIIIASILIIICYSILSSLPQETVSAETNRSAAGAAIDQDNDTASQNKDTESESETNNITAEEHVLRCFIGTDYSPAAYEIQMMCTVVSSEAGYCDDDIQKAVAHTIINRILSDEFPDSIYSVLTQDNQYTAVHSYFDWKYKDGLYPGSEAWNHTMQLCYDAMNEYDFTNGATVYYNPDVYGYDDWFESLTLVHTDQYHRYFKI